MKALQELREETQNETFECIARFFKKIGCEDLKERIQDLVRLPRKKRIGKNGEEFISNTCKLTFIDLKDKIELYKSMKNAGRTPNLDRVRINEALPKDLISAKESLESIAYRWRQKEKGLKTRVQPRNGEMILMTKLEGEAKFNKVAKEDLEAELRYLREQRIEVRKQDPKTTDKRPREEHIDLPMTAKRRSGRFVLAHRGGRFSPRT